MQRCGHPRQLRTPHFRTAAVPVCASCRRLFWTPQAPPLLNTLRPLRPLRPLGPLGPGCARAACGRAVRGRSRRWPLRRGKRSLQLQVSATCSMQHATRDTRRACRRGSGASRAKAEGLTCCQSCAHCWPVGCAVKARMNGAREQLASPSPFSRIVITYRVPPRLLRSTAANRPLPPDLRE